MSTQTVERNKAAVIGVFQGAFNGGNLALIDKHAHPAGLDHQHPDEPSFAEHLKAVIRALRTAFPDLRFEISEIIGEGDWVALHSVTSGTNTGDITPPLAPPGGPPAIPPTGRPVRMAHMHLIRRERGMSVELYHVMDTMTMMAQLQLLPGTARAGRA